MTRENLDSAAGKVSLARRTGMGLFRTARASSQKALLGMTTILLIVDFERFGERLAADVNGAEAENDVAAGCGTAETQHRTEARED
jgi:hypothetical protein